MEIALGLIGVGLTTMVIVLGYIWRSNGRLQVVIMAALKEIQQGQERMQQQMQQNFNTLSDQIQKGVNTLSEMALKQTEILERIVKKEHQGTRAPVHRGTRAPEHQSTRRVKL